MNIYEYEGVTVTPVELDAAFALRDLEGWMSQVRDSLRGLKDMAFDPGVPADVRRWARNRLRHALRQMRADGFEQLNDAISKMDAIDG